MTPAAEPGGLTICVLASGSRGNAVYVSDERTSVLVDAGLSGVEIQRRLQSIGRDAGQLNGILVTHEHSDHIQAVGVLARRFNLPVYMTTATAAAAAIGRIDRAQTIENSAGFHIGSMHWRPIPLAHDAADPVGFTLQSGHRKLGIATDLGMATAVVKQHLRGCDVLILEANHDPQMLAQGPYPWPLKQRIASRTGHLSNVDSHALLCELRHDGLHTVVLAHLSETNNCPDKARAAVLPALAGSTVQLTLARQDRPTRQIVLPPPAH